MCVACIGHWCGLGEGVFPASRDKCIGAAPQVRGRGRRMCAGKQPPRGVADLGPPSRRARLFGTGRVPSLFNITRGIHLGAVGRDNQTQTGQNHTGAMNTASYVIQTTHPVRANPHRMSQRFTAWGSRKGCVRCGGGPRFPSQRRRVGGWGRRWAVRDYPHGVAPPPSPEGHEGGGGGRKGKGAGVWGGARDP